MKKIALVAALVVLSAMSGVALANEQEQEVTWVGSRIIGGWGEGFNRYVVVANDWSDGSTTYEVQRVQFG